MQPTTRRLVVVGALAATGLGAAIAALFLPKEVRAWMVPGSWAMGALTFWNLHDAATKFVIARRVAKFKSGALAAVLAAFGENLKKAGEAQDQLAAAAGEAQNQLGKADECSNVKSFPPKGPAGRGTSKTARKGQSSRVAPTSATRKTPRQS